MPSDPHAEQTHQTRGAVHPCWVCGSTRFTSRGGHCLDWRACQIDFARRLDNIKAEIVDAISPQVKE